MAQEAGIQNPLNDCQRNRGGNLPLFWKQPRGLQEDAFQDCSIPASEPRPKALGTVWALCFPPFPRGWGRACLARAPCAAGSNRRAAAPQTSSQTGRSRQLPPSLLSLPRHLQRQESHPLSRVKRCQGWLHGEPPGKPVTPVLKGGSVLRRGQEMFLVGWGGSQRGTVLPRWAPQAQQGGMRARPRVCCAEQGWSRGRKAPEAATPLLVAEGRCRVSGLKPLRFQHSPWPAAPRSRAGGSAGGDRPRARPRPVSCCMDSCRDWQRGGKGCAAADTSCSRQRFASARAVAQALRFLPEVVLLGTAYPAAGGHGLPFLGQSPHRGEGSVLLLQAEKQLCGNLCRGVSCSFLPTHASQDRWTQHEQGVVVGLSWAVQPHTSCVSMDAESLIWVYGRKEGEQCPRVLGFSQWQPILSALHPPPHPSFMPGCSAPLHHESLEAAGASDLLRLFLSFSLCFPFVVFLLNVKDFFRLALPPPSAVCLFFCFSWKRVGDARKALPAQRSAACRYPCLSAPSSCQSLPAGRAGWADTRKP